LTEVVVRKSQGSATAARKERKLAFAERLETAMMQKGLSLAEVTRRVAERLPTGRFTRSNLSHYRSGRSLPRANVLDALSRVLEIPVDQLAASTESGIEPVAQQGPTGNLPVLRVEDAGDGHVFLQLNQRLSWPDALRVLQALRGRDFSELGDLEGSSRTAEGGGS
jgi:transcriptional regulator with XRE-family HTH domain